MLSEISIFNGKNSWDINVYIKKVNKTLQTKCLESAYDTTTPKKISFSDYNITKTEIKEFKGCALELTGYFEKALIINQEGRVVGGLLSSSNTTKLAVIGSQAEVKEFFVKVDELRNSTQRR